VTAGPENVYAAIEEVRLAGLETTAADQAIVGAAVVGTLLP
jgi:hypothetical protein